MSENKNSKNNKNKDKNLNAYKEAMQNKPESKTTLKGTVKKVMVALGVINAFKSSKNKSGPDETAPVKGRGDEQSQKQERI